MVSGQFPHEGRFSRGRQQHHRRFRPLQATALGAEQYGVESQTANLLAIDYFWGNPVYEPWAGASGDPLPAARWDGPNTLTEGTIEQTGDGFLRLLGGPNGGSDPDSGTPIRSKSIFSGEIRYQIRWESTAGDDVSLQTSFAVQDSGTTGLNTYDAYPTNGYYLIFFAATSTFGLYRRIAGTGNSIATGSTVAAAGLTAIAPGVVWNVAVHADGTNVSAWVWDDGDPRPGSPTFTATDSTYSSGKIRFTVPPSIGGGGEVHIGEIRHNAVEPILPISGSAAVTLASTTSSTTATFTGAGGGGTPPTQVGTATTRNIYSGGPGWPIDAPTGLATGNVVYIGIWSDGSAATSRGWGLAGFTQIFEVQADTSQSWLTVLRGEITGSPPSGFSPSPSAGIPGYWQAVCVAYDGVDVANEVVGTPFESTSPGAGPVDVPGITVSDDDSVVLLYTINRFGTANPTGWTQLSEGGDFDLWSDPYDTGATGNVPIANTQGAQPTIGVLISVPPVSAGPSPITGSSTASLAVLTSTASGTHTTPSFTGTSSRTLDALTSAAAGTHTAPVFSGSSAALIAALTSTASGTLVDFLGTSANTLAPLTSTATGTHTAPVFSGTSARTLDNLTSTASGTYTPAPITGTSTRTLANLTSSAAGQLIFSGTSARTLANVTSTATGTHAAPVFSGTAAVTLNNTSSASGSNTAFQATLARTLANLTSTAAGTFTPSYVGTGASTLDGVTSNGAGDHITSTAAGSYTDTLEDADGTGSGTFTIPVRTGSGSAALAPVTASASGTHAAPVFTSTAAVTLGSVTSTASGSVTPPLFTATAAPALVGTTATASGVFFIPDITGAAPGLTLDNVTGSVVGTYTPAPISGTLEAILADWLASGDGSAFSYTVIPRASGMLNMPNDIRVQIDVLLRGQASGPPTIIDETFEVGRTAVPGRS